MRKKRVTISLSDEWFEWADDERWHRGQSWSEMMEDALKAFEEKLIAAQQQNFKTARQKSGKRKFVTL